MRDTDCVAFLQWCLPRLGLRWAGYRKVHRTVCKRIMRRIAALGVADLEAYRDFIQTHEDEWAALDDLCFIPISRFWREGAVFECLADTVLPSLAAESQAAGSPAVRAWSAGCASGEEPYSLRLAWEWRAARDYPHLALLILATDADEIMIARAKKGRYTRGSLRELPRPLLNAAFDRAGAWYTLRDEFRQGITLLRQNIRKTPPPGPFDLVLCRYLAFTYFDAAGQCAVLAGIRERLRPGGILVIGAKERLPVEAGDFAPVSGSLPLYRFSPT